MGFCKYCGKEVEDDVVVCPYCGRNLQYNEQVHNNNDTGSVGWALLGFFIPVVGLILYLVWKDEKPKNAKKAGIGALVSFCISVVSGICLGISGILGSSYLDSMYKIGVNKIISL